MEKIAAVIVTYNRVDELLKNINMLLNQSKAVDAIYVINNNSTDDTIKKVDNLNEDRITLITLNENLGGAGGFSYGLRKCYEDGYDYIVLMDDDGRPYDYDTIKHLYDIANSHKNEKIMINSLVFENKNKLSFGLLNLSDVDSVQKMANGGLILDAINPFNGTLVNRLLISEIGFPNSSFFIKGDETDYQNRAIKSGAFVATVVDSLYYHPSIKRPRIKKLFFSFENDLEAPWKEYYRARNYTFMFGKNYKKRIFKRCIKSFLLHDLDYKYRNKMMKHGYRDGINKKMGKIVEPGEKIYK